MSDMRAISVQDTKIQQDATQYLFAVKASVSLLFRWKRKTAETNILHLLSSLIFSSFGRLFRQHSYTLKASRYFFLMDDWVGKRTTDLLSARRPNHETTASGSLV